MKDGRVTGPGALDMKGGITVMLWAVKTLLENGWDRYPLKIILAGDEETGHGWSGAAEDYRKEARGALMGFNFETGFLDWRERAAPSTASMWTAWARMPGTTRKTDGAP